MLSHVFICHERISAEPVTYIGACFTIFDSSSLREYIVFIFDLPTILSLHYASGDISEDLPRFGIISFRFVTLFNCHEKTVVQEAVLNEEV